MDIPLIVFFRREGTYVRSPSVQFFGLVLVFMYGMIKYNKKPITDKVIRAKNVFLKMLLVDFDTKYLSLNLGENIPDFKEKRNTQHFYLHRFIRLASF